MVRCFCGVLCDSNTWTVRSRATVVASLMTPSPKTRLNSRGALSCSSTCSTATLSVVAKMAPSARQSCQASCLCDIMRHLQLEEAVGTLSSRKELGKPMQRPLSDHTLPQDKPWHAEVMLLKR